MPSSGAEATGAQINLAEGVRDLRIDIPENPGRIQTLPVFEPQRPAV